MNVVEVGRPGPTQLSDLNDEVNVHDRFLSELREDVDHEQVARHALMSSVQRYRDDRADDRFLFAQLANERALQTLRDELSSARHEISSLHDLTDLLGRDHKNRMKVLKCGGYLHRLKTPRTGGDASRKM